jgi:CubicO group peptidase (beta-lactamase class C family)
MTRLAPVLAALFLLGATPAAGQVPLDTAAQSWAIRTDDDIRRVLVEQLTPLGTGAVVGIIEPGGRRYVTWGRSGTDRPLDQHTLFMIGSLTKVFTSLVLSDMVTSGQVGLDDPVSQYLPPDVRLSQRGRPITLIDLSKHWSGLPSMPTNFPLDGTPNPYAGLTEKEFYAFVSSYDLPEPGSYRYSNVGVSLLGKLLARRASMDYEALLKQRVLSPLGMTSTAITLSEEQRARLAPGHDRYGEPIETWDLLTMPPSGALRSSAHDLLQFLSVSISGDTPLRPAMELQRVPGRALGWGRSMLGGEAVYGHEGGKEGYQAAMIFNPGRGTGVVLLMNGRSSATPMTIARHLLFAGASLPPAPPRPARPKIVQLAPAMLDGYAGTYVGDSIGVVRVARRDGHLFVNPAGGAVLVLWPVSETEFVSKISEDRVTFGGDGLRYWNGSASRTASRTK